MMWVDFSAISVWFKPDILGSFKQSLYCAPAVDETSKLIVKLAKVEFQKGHRIRHPIPTDSDSVTVSILLRTHTYSYTNMHTHTHTHTHTNVRVHR